MENSSRGVWALTEQGLKTTKVEKEAVKRKVVAEDKQERLKGKTKTDEGIESTIEDEEIKKYSWQERLCICFSI